MDDVAVKIRTVLVEELGIDYADITDDSTLAEDLDLDSLELVNLAIELENVFNITVPDASVTANMTVGQVADKIRELKGA
jgi:acyl carrier protein